MKRISILLFVLSLGLFTSCTEDFDDRLAPLAGVYSANITGSPISFDMGVSIENGDEIAIDAPFDGVFWTLAIAEVRDKDSDVKNIKIEEQFVDFNTTIVGDGFYTDGSIQLDYFIDDGFGPVFFQIVGSK